MFHIVDHENVGERSMPHAVGFCDKNIEEALFVHAWNIDLYSENKDDLMDLIPEDTPFIQENHIERL